MMNHSISETDNHHIDFEDDEVFDDSFLANISKTINKAKPESKVDDSLDKSTLNVSALCCDEEISGYDKLTGRTWIYPTNYPVRDYQFNIIKAAILQNTLVSLPTGLGKTFIAAVIMHNFFRWYPLGKIIFTAPTRPLVAQQIEACYNIVAMPKNDTIEMTGHMKASTRQMHWKNKRVFFATPQVIYNDIKSGICPGNKIRCLVIDEAHRARGNYAYCQIVSSLTEMGHKTYRILALSATPGSKVEDVINVVKNLHIAKLELRSENCLDVAPYSHSRKINTVVIELGPLLTHLRQQYIEILDDYARRLKQLNILPQNVGNLSKGRIVMLYKEFQNKDKSARHPQHKYVMKDFTLLIALFHGLELLLKHGSRVFLNFFDEHPEKTWIQCDDRLTALLERLRDDLGINPVSLNTSVLPDGTVPEVPSNLSFGHPKFYKLKEIMIQHFTKAKEEKRDTRAIVFCEYRESVNLVHCLLLQCRPLIVPQMFVGQGASGKVGSAVVSQKQQLRVMRSFRSGGCNALVATCVAEEGLDVGSVDLILCFDISTRSPIRLVQRCGRTGRERGGEVYILVTEGREHQTLKECMQQRDGLNKKIMQSKEVESNLYKMNPRMIPHDFMPSCQKMHIVVKNNDTNAGNSNNNPKKGHKDLRTMFQSRASTSGAARPMNTNKNTDVDTITKSEFDDLFPKGFQVTEYFEHPKEYWAMSKVTVKESSAGNDVLKLNTWLEWQRTLQKTINIGHSNDSEILSSLLQYSDAKRFEMPVSSQNPAFNTQTIPSQSPTKSSPIKLKQPKKKKLIVQKSPSKKDGDIRALFSTATKSTKNYTKLINDLGIQSDGSIPTSLINLFVDLSLNSTSSLVCYICQNICSCSIINNTNKPTDTTHLYSKFLNEPILPDLKLIDDMNADMLLKIASHNENSQTLSNEQLHSENQENLDVSNFNNSTNFDLEFDFESPIGCSNNENNELNYEVTKKDVDKNFDLGVLEEIFVDSSPEEAFNNIAPSTEKNSSDPKETLGFFGLDSIDDIFADSDDEITNENSKTPEQIIELPEQNNNNGKLFHLSPSILSGRVNTSTEVSPILGSQVRKFQLSTKKKDKHSSTPIIAVKRQLVMDPQDRKISIDSAVGKESTLIDTSNNESKLTITQLVDMINKGETEKSILDNCNVPECSQGVDNISTSPVILTQADRKKITLKETSKFLATSPGSSNKVESLIILDSDSDSHDTQTYEFESNINEFECTKTTPSTSTNSKRKFEIDDTNFISPYFNKRVKLDNDTNKPQKSLTLKEKILAAVKSNQTKQFNNDSNINFVVETLQKENMDPQTSIIRSNNTKQDLQEIIKSKLEIFKNSRLSLTPPRNTLVTSYTESPESKLYFNDSDDDFILDGRLNALQSPMKRNNQNTTNHKVRKKKRKQNGFLDLEAEVSDSDNDSGDELTDDSAGSIKEFICDDNVTHHEDIHAHYLKSIKSPVKGVFKIPQLPNKFNGHDVFSQFVEEDNYEMDSFCVDSHIGLTQVNDVSELELAEMALERKKMEKRSRKKNGSNDVNDHSPLVRRRNKIARIESDSEDST